jgi:hypothetical protein
MAGVLPTTVRMQSLDLDALLSECPCRKRFVSIKSFILRAEDGEPGITGVIVGKRNIVAPSAQAGGRRGAP